MPDFLPFLIVLLILAAAFRNDLIFYVFYLFAGLYILGAWWTRRGLRAIRLVRRYDSHLFFGEQREVEMELVNTSHLPLPWVEIVERLPPQVSTSGGFRVVLSLPARGRTIVGYDLTGMRRGYYAIGPLQLTSGDLLGMRSPTTIELPAEPLIVYPKIVSLPAVGLPSRTPFGRLPHTQRLVEDPSRVSGTREYKPGDSWRRINWKASATAGTWQIKQLEPAISLETMIALNLNESEYEIARWSVTSELGVTAAASLAHTVIEAGQAAGVLLHGRDPLASEPPLPLPPRPGRAHLIVILEQLARIALAPLGLPFPERLRAVAHEVSWGATIVVITPEATDDLLQAGYALRRSGFSVLLALTDHRGSPAALARRAAAFGIRAVILRDEESLKGWPGGPPPFDARPQRHYT